MAARGVILEHAVRCRACFTLPATPAGHPHSPRPAFLVDTGLFIYFYAVFLTPMYGSGWRRLLQRGVCMRAHVRVWAWGQNVNVRRERSRRWIRAVAEDIGGRIGLFFFFPGFVVAAVVGTVWMPLPWSRRWVPAALRCTEDHPPFLDVKQIWQRRFDASTLHLQVSSGGRATSGPAFGDSPAAALSDDAVPCCHRPDMRRWVPPAENRLWHFLVSTQAGMWILAASLPGIVTLADWVFDRLIM